ncbi:uncharacterized protein TNCV_4112821 [Trichonephila clavipes]|nr:uncharacterized protein TNCV_4112821 [Trichonephila clavipes]
MNDLSYPSFFPTETGRVDNVEGKFPRAGASQWCPTRFNNGQFNFPSPEVRGTAGLRVLPEVYFSGSEKVEDLLEGFDNNIKFLEIPSDLACAYFKGHLLGIARDWFVMSTLRQNTATQFAQLKKALTKNFPVVRNRMNLEVQFYSSEQSRGQEATDFIDNILKVHKKLRHNTVMFLPLEEHLSKNQLKRVLERPDHQDENCRLYDVPCCCWIVRSVLLEIVGISGHEKVPKRGKPGLERPGRPRGERIERSCGKYL